jgi:hypothetical protein
MSQYVQRSRAATVPTLNDLGVSKSESISAYPSSSSVMLKPPILAKTRQHLLASPVAECGVAASDVMREWCAINHSVDRDNVSARLDAIELNGAQELPGGFKVSLLLIRAQLLLGGPIGKSGAGRWGYMGGTPLFLAGNGASRRRGLNQVHWAAPRCCSRTIVIWLTP